jgi:hypothetical protein
VIYVHPWDSLGPGLLAKILLEVEDTSDELDVVVS